ncbi:MAG: hypothetical protein JNL61_01445 [Rhizobiaceae bacterium]|nr:hypothetical protein [Rhizobiaceae bacterium]
MKLPLHFLRLQPAPDARDRESVHLVTQAEAQSGGKPLFRAPALPTLHQMHRDLPFTVNPRPRLRERN